MLTRMLYEIHEQPRVLEGLVSRYEREFKPLGPMIAGAGRVLLTGTGASLCACGAARWAMMRAGIIPHVLPAEMIGEYISNLGDGDIVILVSQSGQSLETKEAVEALTAAGVAVWGITNNAGSVLANGSMVPLVLGAGDEVSSATKTHTGSLAVMYLLACAAAEANGGPGSDMIGELLRLPEAVLRTLESSQGPVDRLADEMVAGIGGIRCGYSLGAGMNGVTGEQGALMIKEKAFLNFEGMSLSEFRHGPVEAVYPGLPVIVTAVGGRIPDAVGHSVFLAGLGADATLIADATPTDWGGRFIRIHGPASESFSHITATVPHQLLAEGLARRLGHGVDGFRYINKVVDRY